jgi:ABC-type protease/lipase transport system fused ATPase/permease subunit
VWKKRKQGKSNYSLFNYYDHAINGIVSTSRNILRRFIFIGLMSSVVLFLAISYQIFSFLFYDRTLIPPGTLTILIVLSFISVFLLISLSLISEYIVAIHSQVRNNIGVVEKEIVNISD